MNKHPMIFRSPDSGAGGGVIDPPVVPPTPTGGGEDSDKIVFENAEALQVEIDKRLKERLKREEEKRKEAAAKATADAEAKALEEKQEFQKLAEKQKGQLADLQKQADTIEPLNEQVARLTKALTGYRDADFKDIPAHLKPLLEKMDVVEQLEWLTANREQLGGQKPPDINAVNRGRGNGEVPTEELRRRKLARGGYTGF